MAEKAPPTTPGAPPVDPAAQPPTPPGAVPHKPSTETPESQAAAAAREGTPLVPHHPHDPGNAYGNQTGADAVSARRIGAALVRIENAGAAMRALIPPEGVEAFDVPDAEAAARLTEYLAARDQMADAMRAFGPPR